MRKTRGKNPEKMCQLIFWKYSHNNANNDMKILYMFIGNVKPYVQLHI